MASPLLGYNTNIRHNGQLYHVQTEDSGVKRPHIISHLYAEGGRIIATRKTGYAEHVDADNMQEIVRKLMQQQHKALCIELRDGLHDEQSAAQPGAAAAAPAQDPAPPPAAAQAPAKRNSRAPKPSKQRIQTVMLGPGMEADIPKPRASRPPAAKRASRPPAAKRASRPPAAKRASRPPPAAKRASRPPPAAKRASRPPPASKRASRPPPAAEPSIGHDFDALDRAAAAWLAESPIGKAPPEARHKRAKPALEIKLPRRRPTPRGKSLDQVILDYLAEDRQSKGK
jgi:hypothetical protein